MRDLRVARVFMIFMLSSLAAAPARASGMPRIADVTEITIHTSVGTWASSASYDVTIRHGDGSFVRSDAAVLRNEDVQRLLDALAWPNASTVSPERTGFDRAYLLARLDSAEKFLGAAVSLPAARALFDSSFLDSAAMQRWFVRTSYPERVWADKPAVQDPKRLIVIGHTTSPRFDYLAKVDVVGPHHHVVITGRSDRPFMLPLTIADGGTERQSWDPAISRAIVALMPDGAMLSEHLSASNAYVRWASAVANRESVSRAIERDGVDATTAARIAKAAGLTIDYKVGTDPPQWPPLDAFTYSPMVMPFGDIRSAAAWTGSAGDPALPAVRYAMGGIRSSPLELEMLLRQAGDAFHAVHEAKWLAAALVKEPHARAELEAIDQAALDRDIAALKTLDKARAAQVLEENSSSAVSLTIDAGASGSTDWLLLGNGAMILMDFGTDASFGFGEKWYRALPPRPKNRDAGPAGVLLTPDGTIDPSAYRPPVPIM
jgi:hypothetical protein